MKLLAQYAIVCLIFLGVCVSTALLTRGPEKTEAKPEVPVLSVNVFCPEAENLKVGEVFSVYVSWSVNDPKGTLDHVQADFEIFTSSPGKLYSTFAPLHPRPMNYVLLFTANAPGEYTIDLSKSFLVVCGNYGGKDVCLTARRDQFQPLKIKVTK